MSHPNTNQSEQAASNSIERIPRHNGFGDFCFDSSSMRERVYQKAWARVQPLNENSATKPHGFGIGIPGRGGSPVRGFEYFPFLKLPIIVRERVYFWAALSYNLTDNDELELFLEKYYPRTSATKYLQHCQKTSPAAILDHPERSGSYLFTMDDCEKTGLRLEQPLLYRMEIRRRKETGMKTISALSNVATQVRQEVGVCLTRKILLRCGAFNDQCFLPQLLQDRPAFRTAIKSISFSVDIGTGDAPFYGLLRDVIQAQSASCPNELKNYVLKNQSRFVEFCNAVVKNLKLDTLQMSMRIYESKIKDLVALEGEFQAFALIRKMDVARKFEPVVHIQWEQPRMLSAEADIARALVKTEIYKKTLIDVEEALMPDSLRDIEPTTEVQKYLVERRTLWGIDEDA